MLRREVSTTIVAIALLFCCPLLLAQSSSEQDMPPGTNPGGTVTHPLQVAVRGCLKHGAAAGHYVITDNNGTTWKLLAGGVNLGEHANHTVVITGKPGSDAAEQNDNEQGGKTEQGGKPLIILRVLTVKTLSLSCVQ